MLSKIVPSKRSGSWGTIAIWAPQRLQLERADVATVDEDGIRLRVEEARDQADEGRLPGTGRPDDRDAIAGERLERDVLQHRLPGHIGEHDLPQLDLALQARRCNGTDGWAEGSGNQIGEGWSGFRHLLSGGGGVIYAVTEKGDLLRYRDDAQDGTNGPDASSG